MNPEIIGLLATVLVLASFIARGEKRIRTINIAGALLFAVYGFMIGALSTWLLNGVLVLIHIKYLTKKGREETS